MLTDEQKENIIKYYKDGYSISKIAILLKHGKNAINKIVQKAGIVRRNNSFDKETEKKIACEYSDGKSASILGIQYGCTGETIINIVNRHGMKSRLRGNSFKELSEENKKIIKEMWNEGRSQHEIINRIRTGHETLNRWLVEIGEIPEVRFSKKENHPMWKGGRRLNQHGYIEILLDKDDPFYDMANLVGYILEHRYVMAKHLNEILSNEYSIHHIDGDKTNNKIDNLELRKGQHMPGTSCRCGDCGSKNIKEISLKKTEYNVKEEKIPKYSKLFSEEQEKEIISDYEKGRSISSIAKKFEVMRKTIKNILIRNEIEIFDASGIFVRLNEEQIEKFKFMWLNDHPKKDMKKYFNISSSTLNKWALRFDLPLKKGAPCGIKHGQWKGGKTTSGGYNLIRVSRNDQFYKMTNSSGYVLEHRYVMAQHLGRPLKTEEKVHHIDGSKKNNDIKNLQLVINNHGKGQRYKCIDCGSFYVKSVPLSQT